MIEGLFAALLFCALTTFARSNEIKRVEDVRASRNSATYGDGPYDNEDVLTPSNPGVLAVQYYNAYFNGTVTFVVDGKTEHTESLVDTANDIGTFNAFIVNHNLTIRYHQDKKEDLILLGAEGLVGDINQTSCYPFDVDKIWGTQWSPWQFPNHTIYSDAYVPNGGTRGYSKNCSYTLEAPSQGTVWAIDLMGLALDDAETLSINGSLQGTSFQKFYTSSSPNRSVLQRFYSDTEVQIGYNRPNAINSNVPAFRILAATVAVAENCSLAYHMQTFKDPTGKFVYFLDSSTGTHPSKEKCTWAVEVPQNKQLRLHILRCWQGPFSGNALKVSGLTQHWWPLPNLVDETLILTSPYNTTFTVHFDWESDGLHQIFGFDMDYFIEDAGTPSISTTVTPPPTTAAPAETSTTLPTTTSSSPSTFIFVRNILMCPLLALSAYCIRSL